MSIKTKLKAAYDFLKSSDLEQRRMAILKSGLFMLCRFAETKGITKSKDKTIKELKKWSGNIIGRLTKSVNTIYGGKDDARLERFKYYLYYKDILEQLDNLGVKYYFVKRKKEFIKDEIDGINKMLNNPDDY